MSDSRWIVDAWREDNGRSWFWRASVDGEPAGFCCVPHDVRRRRPRPLTVKSFQSTRRMIESDAREVCELMLDRLIDGDPYVRMHYGKLPVDA